MSLRKSDRIHHRKLRRDGVIVEVLKSGLFRVAFGSLVVECRHEDLLPPKNLRDEDDDDFELPKKAKKAGAAPRSAGGMASVDLHGLRVEEALAVVQMRVNDALMSGANGIAIIHGLGTGKLKAAVHRYLSSLSVVKRYQLEKGNAGTTVAYF